MTAQENVAEGLLYQGISRSERLEKAGEVLELFQWSKDNELPKNKRKKLDEELADVYYFLLLLANDTGVDLNKALEEKIKLNEKKYPADKVKGSSKKYTEYK